MHKLFGAALAAVSLAVISGSASAEEAVSASRAVDAGMVKVELGGVIDLQLKQGATPSLTLHGDRKDVTANGMGRVSWQ